jgi:hypothetical protein
MFIGHYHRWLVMTPTGRVPWDAIEALVLDPTERYLVVVGPLISGQFGMFDTTTRILTPLRC